ncbi:MAG: syringomycin biosynthesis enzyme [Burkholderia sp.]|nr:syringomycin biosynthesis enzyme [Burkholderia sp.]
MGKVLNQAAIERYQTEGICFPVPMLPGEEAGAMLARLEQMEAREGGRLSTRTNTKVHLLVPWINDLIRHPKVLDAVEDLLGPNLLCWSSSFFAKNAHDPAFVSWHQDATYWGLSSNDVVTVWLAFTPSTKQSGCMRVVPGSHKTQVSHRDTFNEKNLLTRGQEIAVEVDENDALDVVLQPGQASIHNVLLVHGSEPNSADHRRVGYAIRYIPTHVRQSSPTRDSATLVRGIDTFGHFDLEASPESDFHPDAVARHAAIIDRKMNILYAGTAKQGRHFAHSSGTSA